MWRAASRFPRLLRAVYLAEAAPGGYALRPFDEARRGFSEAPLSAWPTELEPVRRQMAAPLGARHLVPSEAPQARAGVSPGAKRTIVTLAVGSVNADVPALVIPVVPPGAAPGGAPRTGSAADRAATGPGSVGRAASAAGAPVGDPAAGSFQWASRPDAYIVAALDGEYVRRVVLPALVARHFPESDASDYRVAVLSSSGARLFTRGVAEGAPLDPQKADSVTPFFSLRVELARELLGAPAGDALFVRGGAGLPPAGLTPGGSSPVEPPPADTAVRERMSVIFESQLSAPANGAGQGESVSGRAVTAGVVRPAILPGRPRERRRASCASSGPAGASCCSTGPVRSTPPCRR